PGHTAVGWIEGIDRDLRQAGAVGQCSRADGCYIFWDGDAGEAGAASERLIPDGIERVGKIDVRQVKAHLETRDSNATYILPNRKSDEVGAKFKRVRADVGQAVRHDETGQAEALRKRMIFDGQQSAAESEVGQDRAIGKRGSVDPFNSIRDVDAAQVCAV